MIDASACSEYFQQRLAFAESAGLAGQLQSQLDYLGGYASGPGCRYDTAEGKDTRCRLFPDFAPHSFTFDMECRESPDGKWSPWFNGGLVFHSAGDTGVGAPAFSVRLDARPAGWQVHT